MAICISLSSFSTRFTFLIVCRALRASSMRPFSTSHLGLSGRPMNPKNCITLGTPAIPSIYLEKLRSESLTIYQQKTVGTFRYTFAPCSDTYVTLCVCAFMQAIIWKRFLFAALKWCYLNFIYQDKHVAGCCKLSLLTPHVTLLCKTAVMRGTFSTTLK